MAKQCSVCGGKVNGLAKKLADGWLCVYCQGDVVSVGYDIDTVTTVDEAFAILQPILSSQTGEPAQASLRPPEVNNVFPTEKSVEVKRMAKTISKTMIVGADSKKSATSSIGRGLVGGALLGPVGLIGGAMSGKNKNKTTFLIEWSDGSRTTETVKTGGMTFNMYAKYLEM